MDVDNTPITREQVMEGADITNGIPVVWLGEDGDWALTDGHSVSLSDFAAAIEVEGTDDIERCWLVATPHAPDCRDDLEDDEKCQCGEEWSWWGSFVDEPSDGAVPVTRWSS